MDFFVLDLKGDLDVEPIKLSVSYPVSSAGSFLPDFPESAPKLFFLFLSFNGARLAGARCS